MSPNLTASTLVVTPNPEELAALADGFDVHGCATTPVSVGRLGCTLIPAAAMLIAPGGHGKTQMGIQTQYLIGQATGIQQVLCVGAAGRLDESLSLGDVVVGTCTTEHDYKARFHPRPAPRHQPDADLLQQFRRISSARQFSFRIHFGCIASGDEDIVERDRAAELWEETEALCVAWEGAGAARAAAFNGLRFAELRVISDGADPNTPGHYADNVARFMPFISEILLSLVGEP